jgi:uncharacterized membrane protein
MRWVKAIARVLLGAALTFAGISHLTFSRLTFQAQVPTWLPLDADFVVLASGVVEITLGIWLASGFKTHLAGLLTAAFFIAIFPGNISQYVTQTDAFGLNTDSARLTRLFFQPLLVLWALWSTGAWRWLVLKRVSNTDVNGL